MQIKSIEPAKKLQDVIQKITVFKTLKKIEFRQKLTPSPFTCLSYNHYDIPDFKVDNKVLSSKSKLQITGPKTTDDVYAIHNGKLNQILIEFTPVAFYYIFRFSPSEIVNVTVPITDILSEPKVNTLLSALSDSKNYRSQVKILQEFVNTNRGKFLSQAIYVEEAISLIDKLRGHISVQEICKKINISERQFNRKFIEIVGIPPIQYIKIRQLHFIISRIHRNHFQSIKELAYDTGFYDPAHFNNRFKKLTGMSPGQFIKSDEHIAMDYYSDLI